MSEQKKKKGDREKNGKKGADGWCERLYPVQQQNRNTFLPKLPLVIPFIYLYASSLRIHPLSLRLIFLHGKLSAVLISTCTRPVKSCLLRGPIVPVQWHYPSSAHSECLGSGRGYRLPLKESKRVHWRDTHRPQECQTSDPFPAPSLSIFPSHRFISVSQSQRLTLCYLSSSGCFFRFFS